MTIIIGAGITGLVAAYTLQKSGKEVRLLEASEHIGGNISSQQYGPYLLECGPNTLLLNSTLYTLLEELNLHNTIKTAAPEASYRFVLKNGKYVALPSGPASFLGSDFFSVGEKWRIWKERKVPIGKDDQESVDAFFRRRFGDAVADYAVAPFVSGVYAGDPKALIASLAFPKIIAHEHEKGSVIKGVMAAAKNRDKHKGIFSLEKGLQQLPLALAEKLGSNLKSQTPVKAITPQGDGTWKVLTASGEILEASSVITAIPAFALADLIADWAKPEDLAALRQVHYPATAGVYTAYKKSQVSHPLNGFGALHNHLEPSETLGTIFNSTVFPDRCPSDEVILTTFVGGSRFSEKAALSDKKIGALASQDHARFLGVQGEPVFQHVVKWPRGIPQYDANLPAALAVADKLEKQGIIAAGNWRGGISVPDCVKRGLSLESE